MAAQRMCTADAFHAETQQHATNAAVMYAGSAENVHSRHRLHIEKNVWGACLAGSTEDVHSSSDQRNCMPWYWRCCLLAAQRMCTATDVLKILRAAGSTANVHSGGKCEAVFSAENFLNRQFQDGIFLISIPGKYAFLVTFIPDRQIQKQPVETSCLSSLTNCLSPLTNWPKLTEISRNGPKWAEIG